MDDEQAICPVAMCRNDATVPIYYDRALVIVTCPKHANEIHETGLGAWKLVERRNGMLTIKRVDHE